MPFGNSHNSSAPRNKILQALPEAERARLRPLLTYVRWVNGQGLQEPNERIEQVYFVEQGFASVVADAEEFNIGVEVGLLGWESMVGMPALFDPEALSFNRVFVQSPGGAYRMSAARLCTPPFGRSAPSRPA